MFNYLMPYIRNIEELLPHIKDYPEISVNTKADYVVVNYHVAFEHTFDQSIPGWEWRRECRGLIFHKDTGNILRRPFHKFFNVGEKPDTSVEVMNTEVISRDHTVMDKLDGSMVAAFYTEGRLRLGTKAGVTDVSEKAEELVSDKLWSNMEEVVGLGITPIFEFVAPDNKIVVNYSEPKLILTGLRNMLLGHYMKLGDENDPWIEGVERVKIYPSITNFQLFASAARQETGIEGYIIRRGNNMAKLKNEWYIQIHKTKDNLRFEHNILSIILNEQLDDLLPILDEVDKEKVMSVKLSYETAMARTLERIEGYLVYVKDVLGNDAKRVALELVPTLEKSADSKFIFMGMRGKSVREELIRYSLGKVGGQTDYALLKEYLGY